MKPLLVIASLMLSCSLHAQDDGMPFGKIGETDVDRLEQFAKKSGFDWEPEMKRVYEKDEEALARFFKLSLAFSKLDDHARAYGQVLYSSLLNLGEQIGVEAYVKVLDRQSPEVQQRVRDFLYYPMLRVPKEHRKEAEDETRKMYPTLFPTDFQFGHSDPIFADTKT
jgi:hypothetical protein